MFALHIVNFVFNINQNSILLESYQLLNY